MVSNLYWRMGFGWISVIISIVFLCGFLFLTGISKWVFGGIFLFFVLFTVFRYRRWNKPGWRRVHGRSMLLYARLAAEEVNSSKVQMREFDIENPCRELAYRLVGYGKQDEANAMIDGLSYEEGRYFSLLIEQYISAVEPGFSEEQIKTILEYTDEIKFGPQLVIGNVVENTFGGEEATKYVIALLKKEAS